MMPSKSSLLDSVPYVREVGVIHRMWAAQGKQVMELTLTLPTIRIRIIHSLLNKMAAQVLE